MNKTNILLFRIILFITELIFFLINNIISEDPYLTGEYAMEYVKGC